MPVELDVRSRNSQRCVFGSNCDCAVQDSLGIGKTPQTTIVPGHLFEKKNISRVELDSALEIFGRFSPASLPSIDIASQLERSRLVRQTRLCQTEFLPSTVISV